jgi:hypothetical protein
MAYARVEIAPSILAANFAKLGEEVRMVEEAGAEVLHVDVMDGHFVPNLSLGIPVLAALRKATRLPLDVHLMIENPELFIEEFIKAGASRILVHQEATVHLDRALAMIREHGAEAGAVINPATPVGDAQRSDVEGGYGAGDVGQSGFRRAEIYCQCLRKNPAIERHAPRGIMRVSGLKWTVASIWKI